VEFLPRRTPRLTNVGQARHQRSALGVHLSSPFSDAYAYSLFFRLRWPVCHFPVVTVARVPEQFIIVAKFPILATLFYRVFLCPRSPDGSRRSPAYCFLFSGTWSFFPVFFVYPPISPRFSTTAENLFSAPCPNRTRQPVTPTLAFPLPAFQFHCQSCCQCVFWDWIIFDQAQVTMCPVPARLLRLWSEQVSLFTSSTGAASVPFLECAFASRPLARHAFYSAYPFRLSYSSLHYYSHVLSCQLLSLFPSNVSGFSPLTLFTNTWQLNTQTHLSTNSSPFNVA